MDMPRVIMADERTVPAAIAWISVIVALRRRDVAAFIPAAGEATLDSLADHYLDSRLRSAPEQQRRYCLAAV